MIRSVFAFLVGAVVMMLTVAGVQGIGHQFWPLPAGIDPNDHAQMASIVEALPTAAKAWVVFAYSVATALAVLIATAIARTHWKGLGISLGALMLVLCIINFFLIPHPLWMIAVTVAIPIPLALAIAHWRRPMSA